MGLSRPSFLPERQVGWTALLEFDYPSSKA